LEESHSFFYPTSVAAIIQVFDDIWPGEFAASKSLRRSDLR